MDGPTDTSCRLINCELYWPKEVINVMIFISQKCMYNFNLERELYLSYNNSDMISEEALLKLELGTIILK